MRKLMWFTIGFALAAAFCAYAWVTEGLLLPGMLAAGLSVLLLVISRIRRTARIPAAVCLGVALGLIWFQMYSSLYLSKAEAMDGQTVEISAQCTGYSESSNIGTAVLGIMELDGKQYLCWLHVRGNVSMEPGDVLTGIFEFRTTTPSGERTIEYFLGKGVFLVGYQEADAELRKPAEPPEWFYPARFRQTLLNLIDEFFPTDTAPFAKALLLGERGDITPEMEATLQNSGIMHIIAVSGLHVTILFTLISNLCLRRRWLTAVIGIPVLILFSVVGGLSPSIVRACVMQSLMILASLFDRDYDGPTELSFACLVMLLWNPLVITSVSLQLSAGCMIGIFLFQKKLCSWLLEKLGETEDRHTASLYHWVARSVSMTVSAMSLTTPLVAWYFGSVSLIGILTNLLTLWVVSFIFCGILLACLAGWLVPGAGPVLAAVVSWLIRYVLLISQWLARFPLGVVYTRSVYDVIWLIAAYGLICLFALILKKNPGLLTGLIGFGLCVALAISWAVPLTDDCRMTVLDVGQGQCILLQSEGRTFLVDCGGSYDDGAADLAANTLLSQGIIRLDGVVLTHFDRDHSGGMEQLLSRVSADHVFVPDSEDSRGVRDTLEDMAPGKIVTVSRDLYISFGGTEITIFAPVIPDSGNESSLAVLFQRENCDILITGDRSSFGERMLLKSHELPDLEILVAGHHGSKHATCEELLAATTPEIVVISVGENAYGHPAPEVLDRLTRYGCTVYRTDTHGSIVFRR